MPLCLRKGEILRYGYYWLSPVAVRATELGSAERVHLYFSRTENIVAEGKQIQITRRIWHRSKGEAALNTGGRGGDHQTQVATWVTRLGNGGAKKHTGTTGFSQKPITNPDTSCAHTEHICGPLWKDKQQD